MMIGIAGLTSSTATRSTAGKRVEIIALDDYFNS